MHLFRFTFTACFALALFATVGCQRATLTGEPLTAQYADASLESQMEFWHQLSERTIVSNDEAFHAILLFLDEDDTAADYTQRVEQLKARGLMRADFDLPADQAVSRGDLAVALMRGLDIQGGVMARLFKHSPRYATRELAYLRIYPTSSEQQTFTGAQFLGVIALVEDHQARQAAADNSSPEEEVEL